MGKAVRTLGEWLGQGLVGAAVVAVLALIAPLWAIIAQAPGYWVFTAALVTFAAALTIVQRLRAMLVASARTASLKLQLYGDARFPTIIREDNVFRWFYLRNIVHGKAPDGSPLAVESVNFFVSFDRDVLIKTLEISSPDFKLPRHETKEYNQRFAIVAFDGPLPMGTLELKAGF
jgi:hypothetical protein